MKNLSKKHVYKLLITVALAVNLFAVSAYGDEIQSSEAIIVHEDPDQIQSIEISNYELRSFIDSIEDEEKRALLYEISITPVKEESREYIGDIDLSSMSYISAESIKGYKELAQMTNDELREILDEVKAMNAALVKKDEKMLNYDFFHKVGNIKGKAEDVSTSAAKSYTHTMEKTKKDLFGNVQFGLRCKVDWNVSDGKITYLAPTTTRLYDPDHTYYGSLRGEETLTDNDTRGVVFKNQSFGLKADGYASATVYLAGNYYTDGTYAWNGEID